MTGGTERLETRAREVRCRRLDCHRTVAEHLDCPYCWGRAGDVASAEHGRFCDFDPARDPICFGFPPGHGRVWDG